jgi:hypothetical protein
MPAEHQTLLHEKESYVCGNVLLSLNRLGAFKLAQGNQIEHNSEIVKTMKFQMD